MQTLMQTLKKTQFVSVVVGQQFRAGKAVYRKVTKDVAQDIMTGSLSMFLCDDVVTIVWNGTQQQEKLT